MKLSFSTLGCPGWSYDEIVSAAKDLGFSAIEIRGLQREIYAPEMKIFSDVYIDSTMEKLNRIGINVSMFTSGAVVGMPDAAARSRIEAREYIDLSYKSGVKYVRVIVSPHPQPEEVDMRFAKEFYNEICDYAAPKNVTPLIETNGVLADSREMADFMKAIPSENKGVLWDIHHPYRFFGESPELTYRKIGVYVKYLHVKDSVVGEGVEYRMPGHGDVPLKEAFDILKRGGYNGYASLEWVKRWCPELQEPGIVLAHYINFMRELLG